MTLPTTPDSQPTSAVTALEVLKEVQWRAMGGRCLVCDAKPPIGHAPGCLLAQALATDTTAERVDYVQAYTQMNDAFIVACDDIAEQRNRADAADAALAVASTYIVKLEADVERRTEETNTLRKNRDALAHGEVAALQLMGLEHIRATTAEDALQAANARIAELEAEATDLDSYAHQLQIALTGAAGGGSEIFVRHGDGFRADIRACLDKIRERESNKHDVMLQYARRAKVAEAALHADNPAVASTEGAS